LFRTTVNSANDNNDVEQSIDNNNEIEQSIDNLVNNDDIIEQSINTPTDDTNKDEHIPTNTVE
jgi:hypothetical protein